MRVRSVLILEGVVMDGMEGSSLVFCSRQKR
jgi:hypothetical protein